MLAEGRRRWANPSQTEALHADDDDGDGDGDDDDDDDDGDELTQWPAVQRARPGGKQQEDEGSGFIGSRS